MRISNEITILRAELDFSAIRAQGAGGQNVNKVSSAVHLRFDIAASNALPDACKERLLRLRELIQRALVAPKPRKPTRRTRASHVKRLDRKTLRGRLKQGRAGIDE